MSNGRAYEIVTEPAGLLVDRFVTAADGERTADEVATGHLLAHTRVHVGLFVLRWLPDYPEPSVAPEPLSRAQNGTVDYVLVDPPAARLSVV